MLYLCQIEGDIRHPHNRELKRNSQPPTRLCTKRMHAKANPTRKRGHTPT
eukprot:m.475983 g.475983  ORF g.475983 m.475983 type:complete len:50 (+) comp39616_c0_seq1:14-163(+)